MDSTLREGETGLIVYGLGWIAEIDFQAGFLTCWNVAVRDAASGQFTCFAVFENEPVEPHVEVF